MWLNKGTISDCPTIPISLGLSRFALKIQNPEQYAIGIGKIPILTSFLIFSSEFLWYLYKKTKYKIKLSTCARSHANKNKHKNDNRLIFLVNVLDGKCPFRMLEIASQSIKISELSGEAGPHPLAAHAPLALASFIDDWKNYYPDRLDSLLSSWLHFSPWPLKMHF